MIKFYKKLLTIIDYDILSLIFIHFFFKIRLFTLPVSDATFGKGIFAGTFSIQKFSISTFLKGLTFPKDFHLKNNKAFEKKIIRLSNLGVYLIRWLGQIYRRFRVKLVTLSIKNLSEEKTINNQYSRVILPSLNT